MTGSDDHPMKAADLRHRAEETARERTFEASSIAEADLSDRAHGLLHDLRVHQIELEMQNEELRRAQVELDESRARYFDLYDMAPVGYLTLSDRGVIQEANFNAASRLGVLRNVLVHQPFTRFVLKEDQDTFYLHRKKLEETGAPESWDMRMVHQDGTAFWAHLDATVAQDPDGTPAFRVVISDISERKHLEDLLELRVGRRTSALNHANRLLRVIAACNETLVRALDEAELVQEICRIAVEVGGYKKACLRYVEGEPSRTGACGELLDGIPNRTGTIDPSQSEHGYRPGSADPHTHARDLGSSGDACAELELSTWRVQGTETGAPSSLGLPLMIAGQVGAMLEIFPMEADEFQDSEIEMLHKLANDLASGISAIRSRKEREEVLKQLEHRTRLLRTLSAELVQSEQRERHRLAKVLHDNLQQILVAAKWRAGALAGGSTDERLLTTCGQLEDMLELAIQSSRNLAAELSPAVLQEKGLLPALEWLIRQMRERHALTVEIISGQDHDGLTTQVRELLFEAVRELLFNVIKHAGVKQARIRVDQSEDRFELVVEDDGVGFDLHLARTVRSGTGLGLFSIGERLDYVGGWMQMKSAPGRGSQFRLVVPLDGTKSMSRKPESAPNSRQTKSPLPAQGPQAALTRKIRLLVVDDHHLVRQGLVHLLEPQGGIEIVGEACEGMEAVEMARRLHPDVVLMDINMPGMDGVEATRLLHAEQPDIHTIGLSMHKNAGLKAEMMSVGAVAFLCKNDPLETLVAAILACRPGSQDDAHERWNHDSNESFHPV